MHAGKLVFAQLMDHIPWKIFGHIVERSGGRSSRARFQLRESIPRIESFFGTSQNAVKTRVWIAVSIVRDNFTAPTA